MSIQPKRMLVVMAHPDDESFGMAGTIAKYVSEGVEVSLICTTNGDVGTIDPVFMEGYKTVAERRLAELKCAAETLKLSRVITLGYRDSGMAGSEDNNHPDSLVSAPFEKVVERIVGVMREIRPDVVVTFDPFGGYGHPDHIVTHRATVEAFRVSNDLTKFAEQLKGGLQPHQCKKLYFLTFDRRIFSLMVRFMQAVKIFGDPRKMGRNQDIDATAIVANTFPIHASIKTGKHRIVADKARQCHASQLSGVGPRQFSQVATRMVFGVRENFMRSFPPATGNVSEGDLFEDIR